MARPVLAVSEETPLATAAAMMASEGVHHVAVVGANGVVAGIASALDAARWLARTCGYVVAPVGGPRHEPAGEPGPAR